MQNNVKNIFGITPGILSLYIKIDSPKEDTYNKKDTIKILQPTRYSKWKGSPLSLECIVNLLNEEEDIKFIHGGCHTLLYGTLDIPIEALPWIEAKRIEFRDYSFEEIGKEIGNADIILHPTVGIGEYGEPFSLTCLESMLLGKPIIASNSGFVPKLLEGYSRKQIVKRNSKEELYHAIRKWVLGPIPELTANDKKVIEKWKNYLASSPSHHIALYQRLVGEH